MPYYFIQCVSWKEKLRRLTGGSPTPELEPGTFIKGECIKQTLLKPLVWELMSGKGEMPVFFKTPAFVVREDFADALREAGVDNIDYYKVTLHDSQTGQTWKNYYVANVLGLVDCIDMQQSEIDADSPPDTAVLFDTIVIDESRCHGFKILRPMNKQASILVSQELRDYLEKKGFKHVEFVEPEEYA